MPATCIKFRSGSLNISYVWDGAIHGWKIESVDDQGVAAEAGLEVGDVIKQVGDHQVSPFVDLDAMLRHAIAHNTLYLVVWDHRGSGTHPVTFMP